MFGDTFSVPDPIIIIHCIQHYILSVCVFSLLHVIPYSNSHGYCMYRSKANNSEIKYYKCSILGSVSTQLKVTRMHDFLFDFQNVKEDRANNSDISYEKCSTAYLPYTDKSYQNA